MSMTGTLFLSLVVGVTLGSFVAAVVLWPRLSGPGPGRVAGRVTMLLGVNVLVLLTAATQLNAQYLFFAGWTDLRGAITGNITSTSVDRGGAAGTAARQHVAGQAARSGRSLPSLPSGRVSASGVVTYRVTGAASGLTGLVAVQLPPGYARSGATERYPVIEAFQGYPGTPLQWINTMDLGGAMQQAVAARQMRPALIVEPQVEFPPGTDTECVNGGPGLPQVDTFLTKDVPTWVARTFRVQTQRSSWATIGLSAGGYCAAMATMLHPAQYSAAIVMGGYFRPEFGPLYQPYHRPGPMARHYDLVRLAHRAPPPVAIWLETSHVDAVSYNSSAPLLRSARKPVSLHAVVLQHAGHRIGLWESLLPQALAWLGTNVPGFR